MKTWLKNIFRFNKPSSYSWDKLKDYQENKLSPKESNALEQDSLEDGFLNDAVNTPKAFESKTGVEQFEKDFLKKHQLRKPLKLQWTKLITGFAFVGLMGYLVYYIQNNLNTDYKTKAPQETQTNTAALLDTSAYEIVYSEVEGVEVFEPIPKTASQPKEEQEMEKAEIEEQLEKVSIDLISLNQVLETKKPKLAKKYGYTYLGNFKVKIYHYPDSIKQDQLLQIELSGTPAQFENEKEEQQVNTSTYSYTDYLECSLQYFEEKNYQQAKKQLLIVLDHYPEDVNAFFYLGMLNYSQHKWNNAIYYLDKAKNSSVFKEEASYYLALSKLDFGQQDEAKKILKQIASDKGFYQEKAKEVLQQIEE